MTIDKEMIALEQTYMQIGRKMQLLVQTGQELMENGASSSRIVSTMKRVAAYMYIPEEKLHIHTTYTTIMANVSDGNHSITKFQKCYKHGINMETISCICNLSIEALENNYSIAEYEKKLNAIRNKDRFYTSVFMTVGAGAACGGLGMLFGGDFVAFIYTAICAMAGFLIRRQCARLDINPYVGIFITVFITTCLAFLTHYLPGSSTPWQPMIACALFIIPGIPLINAVDDFMDSYIICGLTRAVNTVLIIVSMSFGIVFAIDMCKMADFSVLTMPLHSSYFISAIAAAIAAAGFSTIFNAPRRYLWMIAIGGMIAVCTRNFVNEEFGVGIGIASFIGAMLVSLVSLIVVHWFGVPSHVITIPSIIPMIPGVLMYRILFGIININALDDPTVIQIFKNMVDTAFIIFSISLGVAAPDIFSRKYLDKQERERMEKFWHAGKE